MGPVPFLFILSCCDTFADTVIDCVVNEEPVTLPYEFFRLAIVAENTQ